MRQFTVATKTRNQNDVGATYQVARRFEVQL